jgi:hypothetical protein
MFLFPKRPFIILIFISIFMGCATEKQNNELMGAGLGAALGAGVAALAGGDAGAIIGAAAGGALAGWGVAKLINYQAVQTRSAEDDQEIYGLTADDSVAKVKIRRGSSFPEIVKAGDVVNVSTDYSVIGAPGVGSVLVEESWVLKKDGQQLTALGPERNQRTVGGWVAKAQINIPSDAAPGTYVIEHKVEAGTSYDVDQSVFVVN